MVVQTPVEFPERVSAYWKQMQRAQQLFQRAMVSTSTSSKGGEFKAMDGTSVMAAYAKVGMAIASRPLDLVAAQQSAFGKMADLWMSTWKGEDIAPKDRRFRDSAWTDGPNSPIAGMPVLECRKAEQVIVSKRGHGTGYSGIENPLFFKDNTRMFFGDAKASLDALLPKID